MFWALCLVRIKEVLVYSLEEFDVAISGVKTRLVVAVSVMYMAVYCTFVCGVGVVADCMDK